MAPQPFLNRTQGLDIIAAAASSGSSAGNLGGSGTNRAAASSTQRLSSASRVEAMSSVMPAAGKNGGESQPLEGRAPLSDASAARGSKPPGPGERASGNGPVAQHPAAGAPTGAPRATNGTLGPDTHQAVQPPQPAPTAAGTSAAARVPRSNTATGVREEKRDGNDAAGQTAAAGAAPVARPRFKTYMIADAVFDVEPRYDIKEIVGHGAYGVVCSARDLKTGQLVAAKKIENIFEHRSLAKRTLRELKLLRCFKHENIMNLERVMRPRSRNFNDIYLVSELLETDLACVIRSPQELTDEHCQFFIYQVLRGLKYIHSANVMHRDLKPRNLLVNSNCDLKICDFGLARFDEGRRNDGPVISDYVATRWYRAPEVILRNSYSKAVDIWSVGCILAELIGRKPLFPGRDSFHQMNLIVSVIGTPPPAAYQKGGRGRRDQDAHDFMRNLPRKAKVPFTQLYPHANPLACDLLEKMLTFDPDQRITVEQALHHRYLEELHCEEDEPVCEGFNKAEFAFEYTHPGKDDLRGLIYQEVVAHYPEDDYVPPSNDPRTVIRPAPAQRGARRRRRKTC